jgi:hypothetical protein
MLTRYMHETTADSTWVYLENFVLHQLRGLQRLPVCMQGMYQPDRV